MASPLGFDGALTASLQVTDLDKSIRWYEDVLGFKTIYRLDEMGWAEVATEVAKVSVGLSVVENPQVKGGTTLTFGVRDIDGARKLLEERDVRFDGETITIPEMVKLATFYDPDGNKLMLYEGLSNPS